MYEYRSRVLSVHDGDTVTVDVDLGFSVWVRKCVIRLDGLDAPELPTPEGHAAKMELTRILVSDGVNEASRVVGAMGREIILRTRKDRDDKYGRMLGTIILPTLTTEGVTSVDVNVNNYLIAHGFARPYSGGPR